MAADSDPYDTEIWPEARYDSYRESLRRHYDEALEEERSMKNVCLGLTSSIVIAVAIVFSCAVPAVNGGAHGLAYDLLYASMVIAVIAVAFFVYALARTKKMKMVFDLSGDNDGAEGNFNIAGAPHNVFRTLILRYEVNEYKFQTEYNRLKGKVIKTGMMFMTAGAALMVTSFIMILLPSENSSLYGIIKGTGENTMMMAASQMAVIMVILMLVLGAILILSNLSKSHRSLEESEGDMSRPEKNE